MSLDAPAAGTATVPGVVTGTEFTATDELSRRAVRVAAGLSRLGVGPGVPVAVLARNDAIHLEVAFAAARLGASVLPLNWQWTPEEVRFVLADSRTAAVVGHADLLARLGDAVPAGVTAVWAPTPRFVADAYGIEASPSPVPREAIDYRDWLAENHPHPPSLPDAASAGLYYTSGTTGKPKGVVRTAPTPEQVAQRHEVLTMCYGVGPGTRMLVTTPLHHIFAQSAALTTLRAGGTVVVMPRFDSPGLLDLVARYQLTHIQMVPTMFTRLLRLPADVRDRADVSSLRHVLHTAAPCPIPVKRAMIDWWGPVIWEQYGCTETGVVTLASPEDWLSHPGTVGRPFLTSEVRIVDDDGRELGPGEVGLVYARMHGSPDFDYLGHPEAKAAVTHAGLTTAGDLGYLDADGFLYLVDRSTDVVISGGVNIYPAEVEAALLAHPDVVDAVVFGVPDPEYGETLAAVVVVADGSAEYDVGGLRSFLSGRLAPYKIPRVIERAAELPRDESGKISRRRLRDAFRS